MIDDEEEDDVIDDEEEDDEFFSALVDAVTELAEHRNPSREVVTFQHLQMRDIPFIEGVRAFQTRPFLDERGSFARIFCEKEFAELGFHVAQANLSETRYEGSIRGMHYQNGQAKIVRCLHGRVQDMLLDVRASSPTFGQNCFFDLYGGDNAPCLYIPPGVAHGFQVVNGPATLLYLLSAPHDAQREGGVRWNDPFFGLPWGRPVTTMSERDKKFPLWGAR